MNTALSSTAPRTAGCVLALLVLSGLVACRTEHVRTAPFRVRPDSVKAGDLRGPFQGRVLEADTDKPVAGALVYATWTVESGYGVTRPDGFEEFVTNTDAGGRYRIPALRNMRRSDGTRLSDFHLVIYKRGFVAYRSDRRFSDLGPRRDFAQKNHLVRLQRWRDDYSHARHLRYVGGGAAISALTAWETEEAAAELSGLGGPGGSIRSTLLPNQTQTYLVAAQLLTEQDIKAATSFDGQFESGPLGDEPDTTTYSSQHLKALNRPEGYDVALRIWRLPPGEAQQRYGALMDSLPGVTEVDEIADRSLRATEANIYGIAFLDGRRGVVALLTCGQSQCDSLDVAAELAKQVYARIEKLWPQGGK